MIEYFYHDGTGENGPWSLSEILLLLDRGAIGADTRVKKSREEEWRAAQEFHELAGSRRPRSGPLPLPPPSKVASPDAPIVERQAESAPDRPPAGGILARFDKPMSNGKILAWTFGLIFLILVFLAALGQIDTSDPKTVSAPAPQESSDTASATESAATPQDASPTPRQPMLSAYEKALISRLLGKGYLVVEPEQRSASVDPIFWASIDAKAKKNLTISLANYCADENGTGYAEVDVYDKQSAKKIASYGPFQGFKVF